MTRVAGDLMIWDDGSIGPDLTALSKLQSVGGNLIIFGVSPVAAANTGGGSSALRSLAGLDNLKVTTATATAQVAVAARQHQTSIT